MPDLEKSTLKSKKEAEALQAEEEEVLKQAEAMATPEAQKELTVEEVSVDVKPLSEHNLSSDPKPTLPGETY